MSNSRIAGFYKLSLGERRTPGGRNGRDRTERPGGLLDERWASTPRLPTT